MAWAVKVTAVPAVTSAALTPSVTDQRVPGVTGADGSEAGPVPVVFVAVTVNLYVVPLVRPPTAQLRPLVVHVWPPGEDVTV